MSADRVQVDGDLVRRPAYPWTATVHALLRHVHAAGLAVPEPVSLELGGPLADGAAIGTEVLTLVPGLAGKDAWPLQATERGLESVATLLRQIHDAAADFTPPADAQWVVGSSPAAETICHGDPGPWNMAWEGGIAVGLFDWDLARPGTRANDVAYALDYLAPLRDDEQSVRWHGFTAPPNRSRRVQVFLQAYGIEFDDVAYAVLERKRQTQREVEDFAARGMEPQATWVAQGFLDKSVEHLAWAEANADLLTELD